MKLINKEVIKKLKDVLKNSSKILITTHLNADGDAVGSSLALASLLKKLGKDVRIMTPNDFPEFLRWLPGQDMIIIHLKKPKETQIWAEKADLIFSIDYNDPKRLKYAEKIILGSKAYKVLIDHHPNPVNFADLFISHTEFGSAAELVYYLIMELGFADLIDRDIATCLFAGIMTDTGCFSYNCSYPEVFNTIARLMEYGIDKDNIYNKIYDNYSESRMRLMGYCLNEKMRVVHDYNTAYIFLSMEELKRFDHSPGDTEGFVNLPFSIKGIRFSALFIEKKDHIKISFRSRGRFDVNDFSSKYFNGGGHLNASGGEWKQSSDETIKRFVELLPIVSDQLK